MNEMFKYYPRPEDNKPNNRPKCKKPMRLDIMTGETAVHSFEIPFDVDEACEELEVMYKTGLTIVLSKLREDLEVIVDENGTSIITCVLSSDETMLFRDTTLDTKVQIRFKMKDGTTSYSDIYPVTVVVSLDSRNSPAPAPCPGSLGGLGYTED